MYKRILQYRNFYINHMRMFTHIIYNILAIIVLTDFCKIAVWKYIWEHIEIGNHILVINVQNDFHYIGILITTWEYFHIWATLSLLLLYWRIFARYRNESTYGVWMLFCHILKWPTAQKHTYTLAPNFCLLDTVPLNLV